MQVRGEFDSREVFDVLVGGVDNIGQVLWSLAELGGWIVVRRSLGDLDLLFEHPHLNLLFEEGVVGGCVFRNDLGDGTSPTQKVKLATSKIGHETSVGYIPVS